MLIAREKAPLLLVQSQWTPIVKPMNDHNSLSHGKTDCQVQKRPSYLRGDQQLPNGTSVLLNRMEFKPRTRNCQLPVAGEIVDHRGESTFHF